MKVQVNDQEIQAKHCTAFGFYPLVKKKRKHTTRYETTLIFETDRELTGYEQECMGRFIKRAFDGFGEEDANEGK